MAKENRKEFNKKKTEKMRNNLLFMTVENMTSSQAKMNCL